VFLEELTLFFADGEEPWVNRQSADELIRSLHNRNTDTKRTTSSTLKPAGLWLVFLGLLTPIGLGLLSLGFKDHPCLWWGGLCLVASPFILVSGRSLFLAVRSRDRKKVAGTIKDLFANETNIAEDSSATSTPEDTSVEFNRKFKHILAMAVNGQRKLLIVLDNLDRVKTIDREKLWTAMRTYTDALVGMSSPVWTLVPICVESRKIENDDSFVAGSELRRDPLDKVFQVQIVVPLPLLSDWRAYLLKCLEQAIPNWTKTEFDVAVTIYDSVFVEQNIAPTPRELKMYANQLATLAVASSEHARSAAMAVFAATMLRNPEWDPRALVPRRHDVARVTDGELAALYFRTSPAKALQALWGPEILNALEIGDAETISRKYSQCDELGPTIEQMVYRGGINWVRERPEGLARAAYALRSIPTSDPRIAAAVRYLSDHTIESKFWRDIDRKAGEGLAYLCRQPSANPGQSIQSVVLSRIAESFPEDQSSNLVKIEQWAEGLAAFIEGIGDGANVDALRIRSAPEGYIALLSSSCFAGKPHVLRWVQPGCPPEEVVAFLAGTVGQVTDRWTTAVANAAQVNVNWSWQPLLDAMGSRFHGELDADSANSLLKVLLALLPNDASAVMSKLNVARQSGWLLFHTQSLASDRYRVALCIVALLLTDPDPNVPRSPSSPPSGSHMESGRNIYVQAIGDRAIADDSLAKVLRDYPYAMQELARRANLAGKESEVIRRVLDRLDRLDKVLG